MKEIKIVPAMPALIIDVFKQAYVWKAAHLFLNTWHYINNDNIVLIIDGLAGAGRTCAFRVLAIKVSSASCLPPCAGRLLLVKLRERLPDALLCLVLRVFCV